MRFFQRLLLILRQLNTFLILLLLKKRHFIRGWKYYFASPLTTFRFSGGKLKMEGQVHLEDGVRLYSCGGKIHLGEGVFINRQCTLVSMSKIFIGKNTLLGNNISIFDHDHRFTEGDRAYKGQGYECAPVFIGENVWLGAHTVVLKGVRVGNNSIIAAGSVVAHDVPAGELWGGVPAKKIRALKEGVLASVKEKIGPNPAVSPPMFADLEHYNPGQRPAMLSVMGQRAEKGKKVDSI